MDYRPRVLSRKGMGIGSRKQTLSFGIFLGLAAGLSPGPLITLVVSETLKNGRRKAIEVAVSPLISELPIILFVLLILSNVTGNGILMAIISLVGACYLTHLGLSNLKANIKESKDHHETLQTLS